MATHSSVLAWRIPGTEEPGGLPSGVSQSWTRLKRPSSSSSSMRHPLSELFHLFSLLQMPNDLRMVVIEFFGNFCSCKRISFDDCSNLVVVSFQWLATTLLNFKDLVSFAKLLEPPLHCTFVSVPAPNTLLMLRVVFAALQPILNSNKKIT